MTHLLGGVWKVVGGLLQIATAPLRIIAGPFGCLFAGGFSVLLLLGVLFLVFYFVGLQHAGPQVQGETVTVRGSRGATRTHLLREEGVIAFDVQVSRADAGEVAAISLSEGIVNAKLHALLEAERAADPGFPIDSLIVVFTPDRATFFVNGGAIGRTVGVEVRVEFRIDAEGRIDLAVDRVKLGGLPRIPFSKQLADLILETTPLDDEFEDALPEEVRAVRILEEQIVIEAGPAP